MAKEFNPSLPEDLAALSDEDLGSWTSAAMERFDALASGDVNESVLTEMSTLTKGVERARGEKTARTEAAAAMAVQHQEQVAAMSALRETESSAAAATNAPVLTAAKITTDTGNGVTVPEGTRINASLADAQANAPAVNAPREEPVLVASADIPGFTNGARLAGIDDLVAAMTSRARNLPVTTMGNDATRYPIASLQRRHKFNLSLESTPKEINEVLTAAANPEILIASGGWCSPSEISYDFFNVVCEDGMIDLPTVGINRGGIRWPTSASFADVVDSLSLWSWTETQDIAAATGTAQSGVKTCASVPCPEFNEERLACDGLCLTVGNLTEDAYPELIANHTRLLFAAHAHKINAKKITQLVALATASVATTGTYGEGGSGVVNPVLGALELSAIDYRERYAMCEGAILEVVLPRWLRGAMRSDLRKRTRETIEMLSVSDSRLMQLFDAINIRVQWVNDWQVRAAGFPGLPDVVLLTWPTTVQFLMYAPGTVVLGQGMRLDLGVIRDSVLNETNDFTAQWMEECWLIFQPGHEIRTGIINICPDGTVGAADLTACSV